MTMCACPFQQNDGTHHRDCDCPCHEPPYSWIDRLIHIVNCADRHQEA